MVVLLWRWRHQVLSVDDYATVDDAVRAAEVEFEHGSSSLDHIEVIEDGISRHLTTTEYEACRQRYEQNRERRPYVRPTHRLFIRSNPVEPDWAEFDFFTSELEARAGVDRLLQAGIPPHRLDLRVQF